LQTRWQKIGPKLPEEKKKEVDELVILASMPAIPLEGAHSDPLAWWATHSMKMPVLASLARKYLCVQATSAASGRVWSSAGNIQTKKRNKMLPETLVMSLFCHENRKLLP